MLQQTGLCFQFFDDIGNQKKNGRTGGKQGQEPAEEGFPDNGPLSAAPWPVNITRIQFPFAICDPGRNQSTDQRGQKDNRNNSLVQGNLNDLSGFSIQTIIHLTSCSMVVSQRYQFVLQTVLQTQCCLHNPHDVSPNHLLQSKRLQKVTGT